MPRTILTEQELLLQINLVRRRFHELTNRLATAGDDFNTGGDSKLYRQIRATEDELEQMDEELRLIRSETDTDRFADVADVADKTGRGRSALIDRLRRGGHHCLKRKHAL